MNANDTIITGYSEAVIPFPANWNKTPFTHDASFVIGIPRSAWLAGNAIHVLLEHNNQINSPDNPSSMQPTNCKLTVIPRGTGFSVVNAGPSVSCGNPLLFQGVVPCDVRGDCFASV